MKPMKPLNAIGLAMALAVPLAIGLVFLLPVVAPTFYAEYIAEPEPDASIWPDTHFPTFGECLDAQGKDWKDRARDAIVAYEYLVEATDWPSFEQIDLSANWKIKSINGYSLEQIKFIAYEYCTYCYSVSSCAMDSDRVTSKWIYKFTENKKFIEGTCNTLGTETKLLPKLESPEGCNNALEKYVDWRQSNDYESSIFIEGE